MKFLTIPVLIPFLLYQAHITSVMAATLGTGVSIVEGIANEGVSCATICERNNKVCNLQGIKDMSMVSNQASIQKNYRAVIGNAYIPIRTCGPSDSTNKYCFPGFVVDPGISLQPAYYVNKSYDSTGGYNCGTIPDYRVTPYCPCKVVVLPTKSPTKPPTESPTKLPTKPPTESPTKLPTEPPTESPTKLPTKPPTESPTKTPIVASAGAQGDPHFNTWSKKRFDFHGVCDLVMLSNEKFENNSAMTIHIRTRKMRMWSYISLLAIRIGEAILEVTGKDGGSYNLSGDVHQGNNDGLMMFSGYPIIYTKKNKKQQTFRLNLGNLEAIVIKTWNSFVSVHFENPESKHFKDSTGLMGSFPGGIWLARDNVTILDDANKFGQEWQVKETETKLFQQVQGPQQPLKKCEIPSSLDMRRRLGENTMTKQHAETACIGVDVNSMDLCIFDVMASSDEFVAGAY